MKEHSKTHLWNAEEYYNHSSIQYTSAIEILNHCKFEKHYQALDIGCGDGKITAILAHYLSQGKVHGIDLSPEMIKYAKEKYPLNTHSNLSFSVQNAAQLEYKSCFDVIFSSFCLQWITELDHFIYTIHDALNSNGLFVITVPLGISQPLEQSIEEITSKSTWKGYFESFVKTWEFHPPKKYEQLLKKYSFSISHFKIEKCKKLFDDLKSFSKYVLQWFPYLKSLPEAKQQVFFTEVIDCYLKLQPILDDGTVIFEFERIDLISKKTSF